MRFTIVALYLLGTISAGGKDKGKGKHVPHGQIAGQPAPQPIKPPLTKKMPESQLIAKAKDGTSVFACRHVFENILSKEWKQGRTVDDIDSINVTRDETYYQNGIQTFCKLKNDTTKFGPFWFLCSGDRPRIIENADHGKCGAKGEQEEAIGPVPLVLPVRVPKQGVVCLEYGQGTGGSMFGPFGFESGSYQNP